jgi:hypothetical protein
MRVQKSEPTYPKEAKRNYSKKQKKQIIISRQKWKQIGFLYLEIVRITSSGDSFSTIGSHCIEPSSALRYTLKAKEKEERRKS